MQGLDWASAPPLRAARYGKLKPGATVLASVRSQNGREHPALVVQSFGKGRTGALLIGDFWRWQLKSDEDNDDADEPQDNAGNQFGGRKRKKKKKDGN